MISYSFNDIKISSIKYVEEPLELISIEVEPDHNYFVGNLLVHNTGPQGSKGQKGASRCSRSSRTNRCTRFGW